MGMGRHSGTTIRRIRTRATVVALVAAAACSTSPTEKTPSGQPAALTALPRALTANETKVSDADNALALALWGKLTASKCDTNVVV